MTEAARPTVTSLELSPPDRKTLLVWVWVSVRPYVGWVLAIGGAVSLFLGWYFVSGEALTAKQLPYLVSAGLTGVALFIMAGVFLATDDVRREFARISELERKVDDLYALFVDELKSETSGAAGAAAPAAELLALPTGTSYHLPGCSLVARKADAARVDERAIIQRGLRACRLCSPAAPAA